MDANSIINRYDKLRKYKSRFQEAWDDVQRYVSPHSPPILGDNLNVGQVDRENHDNSAAIASRNLTSVVFTSSTPPDQMWIRFKNANSEVEDSKEIQDYLREVQLTVMNALNESNFYIRKYEFDGSRVDFGTGIMYCEEGRGNKDLNFRSAPIGKVALAEDYEGYVDTVYREFEIPVRELVQKFGYDVLSDATKAKFDKNPFEEIKVLHCVYPRMDHEREKTDKGKYKSDRLNMPFAEYWVEYATKTILREGGYRTFPYIVSRWQKEVGEVYGHGPTMDALPDIRMLNRMEKSKIQLAERITNPPKLIIGMEKADLDFTPGSINHITGEAEIHDLITGANYPITADAINDKKQAISSAMYVDQFAALQRMEKEMTATEAEMLKFEILRILAPILGRNQPEILQPLFIRVLDILDANGKLPPAPEGVALELEYVNDLSRAMRLSEVNAVRTVIINTAQLANVFPEIMDNIDPDAAYNLIKESSGIPNEVSRSAANRDKIREQRAQAQQQAQQIQMAQIQSEIQNTAANTEERSARAEEKRSKVYGNQ